ncbi:hypothetical protein Bca4012_067666 [Brassica carinata]
MSEVLHLQPLLPLLHPLTIGGTLKFMDPLKMLIFMAQLNNNTCKFETKRMNMTTKLVFFFHTVIVRKMNDEIGILLLTILYLFLFLWSFKENTSASLSQFLFFLKYFKNTNFTWRYPAIQISDNKMIFADF